MSVSGLTDRDLCLALAERLGMKVCDPGVCLVDGGDHEKLGRHLVPKSAGVVGWRWLLTPAGAFAVLGHFENQRREDGESVWGVQMMTRIKRRGFGIAIWRTLAEEYQDAEAFHENLARAIAEAAYAALGEREG